MHPRWWILVVLLPQCSTGSDDVTGGLTRDYFGGLLIRQIVAFGCWDSEEGVKFSRLIMGDDHSLTYVSIQDDLDMERILKVNYYRLGIFLNLDCPGSEKIFDQFHRQQLRHNESYFWLMPTTRTGLPKYFEHLPLNIATEMTAALKKSDGEYTLYDVYNPSYRHGGELNVTRMGSWSVKNGLNIELTEYKYRRRGNLYGLGLNASIVVDHPAVPDYETYIHNPINPHYDTMHRYNFALTRQLRDYYNFTMNLSRGTTWGYLINGSFNGIIGDMIKGIVDFGATPFQFKPERIDVIEYTVQGWLARPCLIFRHPKKNNLSNPFLRPFEMKVWYWIAIFGIVLWSALYLTVKVETKFDPQKSVNTIDTHPASETVLITAAAICQQGLSDGPRCISGRITFLTLFIWGLMLYQFYSASIVGSLLSGSSNWITTLQDLVDSDLEVGIEDMAYNHDFFATTTDPVAQELYNKKVAISKKRKTEPYFSAEEGIKLIQKGGFAFQVDVATAYKFIEETFNVDEICDLVEIQLFPPKHTATGTAKHSPFKKMITYGLRKVMERGTPRRLLNIWMHRRPQCPESHKANPLPVVLTEFSPALFLLIIGIMFATLVMAVERTFLSFPSLNLLDPESR
ncbi:ionotropic receptor 75a [Diachasma alloeum]|uniref:Ionotropic receptor 64a n=1 Tax=Diachasma alloeum TaxID=454923 RepID=A0A4E0S4J4_9HYME|nr:ionotropic receptor 75a [Diachasma alloeum]THK33133.1 ionotropic receptor 64a [Diachasma alloeum]